MYLPSDPIRKLEISLVSKRLENIFMDNPIYGSISL